MADNRSNIVLPDGKSVDAEENITERAHLRAREDEEFQPVIIKRSDEALRHPDDTLEHAIAEGLEQLKRPLFSLILSAIAGGLILGFTAMAVAVVYSSLGRVEENMSGRLVAAAVYPLGFIICIVSGTQLFTEHTATSVYPVLDRRVHPGKLLQLWSAVIAGNLAGACLSAFILATSDEIIGAAEGYVMVAEHLVSYDFVPLLLSSLLAGWLMAQGAWLVLAARSTTSQILCIYIVTFLIGIGGLHHSIAGAVEMLTAYFISDRFAFGTALMFIGTAMTGNLAGGSVFVALLNYAHIKKTQIVS